MIETTLQVQGMTCGHCKMSVEQAVGAITGVSKVEADVAGNKVVVQHEPGVSREQLARAIDDVGFEVTG